MGYNEENIFNIAELQLLASESDFSVDLKILPNFNPGDLYYPIKLSKNLKKYNHLQVVDKPVDNPSFCNSEFVENVRHKGTNEPPYYFTKCIFFFSERFFPSFTY